MDTLLGDLQVRSRRPIALFFGAGASKTFGFPITRDLMLEILRLLRLRAILAIDEEGDTQQCDPCKELLNFLRELLPGERDTEQTVPMLTSVLSLLDFSLASGQALLPGRTLDQTRHVRQLLERAVLEVIPDKEGFDKRETEDFATLLEWLAGIQESRRKGALGIITTNYDMIADRAALCLAGMVGDESTWSLSDVAKRVDFGFRWVRPDDRKREKFCPRPQRPRVALYKLHGSTDWLRCPLCENLYIDPRYPIAWKAAEVESAPGNHCHCGETRLEAQIVSPSFIRQMQEPNLIAIWQSALDLLREADRWVIIGYSFPDEDVGLRALFTRAFGSKKVRPKISVIQLDDKARLNYESFFPPDSLQYLTGGLGLLLDRWKRLAR